MKKHKLNIYPEMGEEDYKSLLQSIKNNGYYDKFPIIYYGEEILDGWNRYKVCKEIGITPTTEQFIGTDYEALNYVIKTNVRRNLTSQQKAAIAISSEEVINTIKEEVRIRKNEKISNTMGSLGEKVPHNLDFWDDELPEPLNTLDDLDKPVRTTKILADTFNTNEKYIKELSKIKNEDVDLFEMVKQGDVTLSEIKKNKVKKSIEKQIEDIENLEQPDGLFDLIVLDPPWNYGREYDPETSRVGNPYPEMNLTQLMNMDIPSKDDCILFLWTTQAFIFDAKQLLDAHGFSYKGMIVWNKEKMGMGSWLRMQCEFCLVGIKGKPIWNHHDIRDIITEPRREHSRKPDGFYQMCDDKFHGRFLDYFSRSKFSEKWNTYGNDATKFNNNNNV